LDVCACNTLPAIEMSSIAAAKVRFFFNEFIIHLKIEKWNTMDEKKL
jgi:hypothetical protein